MMENRITPADVQIIKTTFSTSAGKKALEIFDRVFYNTISFSLQDARETAFKEGHRDLVQFIHNCVLFDNERVPKNKDGMV